MALAEESVVRALAGREVAKVIIRAPKLVSIVPSGPTGLTGGSAGRPAH